MPHEQGNYLYAYIAPNFSAGILTSVAAQPPYLLIYSETKLKPTQYPA
jgi:hypothetical protein